MNGIPDQERTQDDDVRAAIEVMDKILACLQELGDFARETRGALLAAGSGSAGATVRSVRERTQGGARAEPLARPLQLSRSGSGSSPVPQLTQRQQQVLKLLAEGASNRRIARLLRITEQTVKAHLHMVYQKLGAADRTEAVVIAMHRGLTSSISETG
ncbi:response regulator transcription factor [Amycolatopsis sp. NPDC054798]